MRKTAYVMVLTLALICLTMPSKIPPARASETVYIRADGSIDPSTAPIFTADNVTYTFTDNISDSIVVERSNITIDGAYYTVEGLGSGNGFDLYAISNVTIKNINIKGFAYGIYLELASQNTISGNNITENDYDGIELRDSSNNSITRNNIMANNWFGIGLYYSSNNSISWNNIINNYDGIEFYDSTSNNISGNSITINYNGMELYYSSDNSMFHNNLVDNTYQVYTESSVNLWDDGYPSGGNYWSNHTKMDNYRGPNQNVPGSDGICDTPYTINTDNQDNYPLTKPYGDYHDIGITNVTTSKTIVGQGYNSKISTKIINYGINTETFSITAYANTTVIDQRQITLTSRNSTTATFTWNTSGFAKGSYVMSAYAWPIQGETDTADNTKTDSTVLVTVVGDVNGDRMVEISDLVLVIAHIPSKLGSGPPNYKEWDPNMDVNSDDLVDVSDIVILINNFLAQW
jgi:parallel beta-helix repeat protein